MKIPCVVYSPRHKLSGLTEPTLGEGLPRDHCRPKIGPRNLDCAFARHRFEHWIGDEGRLVDRSKMNAFRGAPGGVF